MYQEQRLAEILELLAEKKQLSAKDMIEHFQVSKDTIRRDFSILSERKLVQRTHGGIIPLDTSRQIPSFNDRQAAEPRKKGYSSKSARLSQAGADCLL